MVSIADPGEDGRMSGDRPQIDPQASRRIAWIGLIANALLATGKLVAGIVGQSFALVADAVESLTDVAGSAIVWLAMRYGDKPADVEHPFGHGKVEALAGLALSLLVLSAGVGIAVEAVDQIANPQSSPAAWTLLVLVGVVVIKELLARAADRAAHVAGGSSAGSADAGHHRADAITSGFAFVGIAVAVIGGPDLARADDVGALLAALVILWNGVRMAREPWDEILDRDCPGIASEASRIALTVPEVLAIEQCHARRSGRGYRLVMHAEVDPEMTVDASHRVTGKVKAVIRSVRPEVMTVLVHVEPHLPDRPRP